MVATATSKAKLAAQARSAAVSRILSDHTAEFEDALAKEREDRGLPPVAVNTPLRERLRAAEEEIARLRQLAEQNGLQVSP